MAGWHGKGVTSSDLFYKDYSVRDVVYIEELGLKERGPVRGQYSNSGENW